MHTRSPWSFEETHSAQYPLVVIAPEGAGVADIVFCGTRQESLCNARLIAAAPDLLEALQGLVDVTEDDFYNNYTMARAKAAITKAKGV